MKVWKYVAIALSIVTVGCGGGGDTGSSPVAKEQTFAAGPISATFRSATPIKPLVSGNNTVGAAFTGVAGVTFTQVTLTPPKSLDNTLIAYSRAGQLWTMDPNGYKQSEITTFYSEAKETEQALSPNGRVAAITHWDDSSGSSQLFFVATDGSFKVRVTAMSGGVQNPTWSPNGSVCAFVAPYLSSFQIFTVPASGAPITRISDGTSQDVCPTFSPDGSKIYFWRFNNGLLKYVLYQMNANGTGVVGAPFNIAVSGADVGPVAISPDGTTALLIISGAINSTSTLGNGLFTPIDTPPSGFQDSFPSYSPDGKYIVWQRSDSTTSVIWKALEDGSHPVQLTSPQDKCSKPRWGNFLLARNIVGAGGSLGTSASGFLFSQSGPNVPGFLAFTAGTPSTATIKPQSAAGDLDNVVFQVSGNSITNLAYVNGPTAAAITVVPTATNSSAGGAIVGFDERAGTVLTVVPYAPTAPKMAPVRKGDVITYSGRFQGIWDSTGKNLAPSGASSVALNAHTGKLVSFK